MFKELRMRLITLLCGNDLSVIINVNIDCNYVFWGSRTLFGNLNGSNVNLIGKSIAGGITIVDKDGRIIKNGDL